MWAQVHVVGLIPMDSIRKVVEKANSEEEQCIAENARFVEEQRIRKAFGPAMWAKLLLDIEDQCKAMARSPVNLGVERQGTNDAELSNERNGILLSLSYNSDVPCVFLDFAGVRSILTFRVDKGSSLMFLVDGVPRQIGEIAIGCVQKMNL
jgi:hypothetical protein